MNVGWLFAHSATPLQELRHVETNGKAYHMRAIATEEVPPSVIAVIAATIGEYCDFHDFSSASSDSLQALSSIALASASASSQSP